MYNFVCDFLLSLLTNNRWLESTVTKKELIVINRNLNTIPSVVLCCCFRKNAFQVIAVDGVCSGVLQFPTPEDCLDWLHAIASNISSLTKHNVSSERRLTPSVIHANQGRAEFGVNFSVFSTCSRPTPASLSYLCRLKWFFFALLVFPALQIIQSVDVPNR